MKMPEFLQSNAEPACLPSGFALMQAFSQSVLRNWPPPSTKGDSHSSGDAWYRPYDSALEALEHLQADIITGLQRIAREIQVERNRASPFFNLPTEVFLHIFQYLEGDVRDKFSVSQTCSLWRRIMTQDPFLWTMIDLDTIYTSEIASKVFRRAKDYPLQLRCNIWNGLRLSCVSFEMCRVQELETIFTVPMFRTLCRKGAPLLKRFVIAGSSHNNMITYLPYLFAKTHPLLTDLTMIDCRLMLTAENYRGLTKLKICFSRPMTSLRQGEDFLCIFRGCPDLEELHFENLNLYHDYQQPTQIIHLARLQTMYLRLSLRDMNCLLSAISAPPTLRLSILTYGFSSRRGGILESITTPGQPSLSLLAKTRHIFADQLRHAIFTYPDQQPRQPSLSYEALHHDLSSQFTGTSDDLAVLAELYPMPELTSVRVRNIKSRTIIKLLIECPSIAELEVIFTSECAVDTDIIPAIMEKLRSSTNPFLPKLRTLRLENVYIYVETLFDLVELRRECAELRNIFLCSCSGDLPVEEMMETLEEEFEVATWTSDATGSLSTARDSEQLVQIPWTYIA